MSALKQFDSGSKDLKDNSTDECIPPRRLTKKTSSDEQIKKLKVIFESVEDMLGSPDYDADLREELYNACNNYMNVLLTAKRDLLRNDCGIVVTGEASAGKTTLINQLIGQKVLKTGNLPTTRTITRIRDSETMKIQCFSKEETLTKEEEVPDVKKMKSIIEKLTDIKLPSHNASDIYFMDVYLPVPILKGNVIVVDTPGIGENDNLDNILLDFLPHAVSFVFVVNAKVTGGMHENKLLKILKTIMDNREKMPCFDPREVMILTNQWDAIENDDSDSDEDDDSNSKKEDEHTETYNLIKEKFEKAWCSLDEENLYRVSLTQVRKGVENFFTAEYKRFQTVLKKTIEKNENKRITFYYRFLKDFIQNAERGTLARLNILERSEEEQRQIILQNRTKIENLQSQCKKSKETLEKYKTDIINSLTKKLHDYLTSHDGKEEILNPHGSKPISKISLLSLQQEVQSRFSNGLQRWGTGQEAALIMKPADDYLRSQINDVESKLHDIEISMTGKEEAGDFTAADGAIIVLAILTLPITLVLSVAICLVFLPLSLPILLVGHFAGFEYRQMMIDDTYNKCIATVPMKLLKKKFEESFGDEYDKVIVHIFGNHFPNLIRSMIMTNERLLEKHKIIKQNQDLFVKLGEKIRLIQEATESFEMTMDFD